MLYIRNIEKLNSKILYLNFNSRYRIEEVIEDFRFYKILIGVLVGPNKGNVYSFSLSRIKDNALNRYRLIEVLTGVGMYVTKDDIRNTVGMEYYISQVIQSSGI